MNIRRLVLLSLLLLGFGWLDARSADAVKGYQAKVKVSAPTRIDWTFAVSTKSVAEAPAAWLGDYDSTKQTYEVFVPPNYDAKKSYPVILFISAGDGPGGWKEWEAVCKKEGVIFASPHGAGNGTKPVQKRHRIILDVLDDLRRTYNIDPDRTYLSGHSGGARVAGQIAFALPEYVGGIAPSCAGVELRPESWLRHRAIDRLSVALLTGDSDFNCGEVERYRGPMLNEIGIRTKVWVAPKTGHSVPTAVLPEAFKWLEEGLPKRRELAKKFPTSRIDGNQNPTRDEWSKLLLKEGKDRLQERETLFSGLMQLQGCMTRWDGLPAAAEAKKLLLAYDARKDKPWEEEDIAEQRRFLIAQVRGLDAYASGPLPKEYAGQRVAMAKEAMTLWLAIFKDGPDTPAGAEAKKRIPELAKIVDAKQ
ncbi:MAG: hypothetical protein K2R98_16850 [Gemmataceae bacterium]|nr:hypothetical protein [Gemmataceae bacterium]